MTIEETVPNAGSRVGRYVIIREVAQGALGPLYIAEREVGEGVTHGLARVVALPPGLPAKDEQVLADAIWDSTNLAHELVLRVADVVSGKGWLALVHEHSEGSLIEFLQSCSTEMQSPFPAKVASRIALDVIEGLEQSRDRCAAANIPWRPGSVAPGSLLLGPDGRVRALDGQINAAALRVAAMRQQPGATSFAAPEAIDDVREPTERSDVFSIGVLLWELLTGKKLFDGNTSLILGHGFKVPKITNSLPAGVKVPQGLVYAVHTAVEAEPMKRQASLRELAVAIVMGVEEVATYEQVIAYTDSLLVDPSTRDDDGERTVMRPALSDTAVAEPPAEAAPASPPPGDPAPVNVDLMPTREQESVAVPLLDHAPAVRADSAVAPAAAIAPEPAVAPAAAIAPEPAATPAATATPEPTVAPEPELSKMRDKLDTLPGYGSKATDVAAPPVVAAPAVAALPGRAASNSQPPAVAALPGRAASNSQPPAVAASLGRAASNSQPPAVAATPSRVSNPSPPIEPFRLLTDEPVVPLRVQPVQAIDARDSKRPEADEAPVKSSPSRSSSARPAVDLGTPDEIPGAPKKRVLQLSMGTLIFGFSTTVLAVIVLMLVLQRTKETPPSTDTSVPPQVSVTGPVANVNSGAGHAQVAVADPVAPNTVKEADAGIAAQTGAKVDHHKKSAKDSTKSGKSSAPEDGPPSGDSKGQAPNKHYVPNEL